ncbi:MAG: hypothetical protein WC506_06080 [Candidatus Micrarchaeia archaeon]
MNIVKEYLILAIGDLKAAEILQKNKLYPYAIYFTIQALEKVTKAQLILNNTIPPEQLKKKIGHNLFLGFARYWRQNKTMWDAHKIMMSNPKFKIMFNDSESHIKNEKEIAANIKAIESHIKKLEITALDKNRKQEEAEKTIERLDKYYSKTGEEYEKQRKQVENICSELNEKIMTTENEEQRKKLEENIRIIKNAKGYLTGIISSDYILKVIQELAEIMPNQDELRYPESNPLDKFNENHPLVKNLEGVNRHLKNSIEFTLRLDLSSWDN